MPSKTASEIVETIRSDATFDPEESPLLDECLPADRAFVKELLDVREHPITVFALVLAASSNWDARDYEELLKRGLQVADTSEIGYWFASVGQHLAPSKTIEIVEQFMDSDAAVPRKAWYHLNSMIRTHFPDSVPRLEALRDRYWRTFGKEISVP